VDPSRVMVGQQPMPLVDNLPGEESVLLLNRGLFVVYVGGPYVDGPGTGVPLAPLGSLAVPADRQWWGLAEPAAKTAQQAVYRVPGGTSYSPAPSEIAAQIQASQLAAQIGAAVPVPPSAAAIAGAGYSTGTRAVDAPRLTITTLTAGGSSSAVDFDVGSALSLDLRWFWRAGTARPAGTARAWGSLQLTWSDGLGSLLEVDTYELCNEQAQNVNGTSHAATIRCPAVGSHLLVTFIGSDYGAPALLANDQATLIVGLSSRQTDRNRYVPTIGQGNTPGLGYTGILYTGPSILIPAGATSPRMLLESFSGPVELHLYTSQTAIATVNFGSQGDGTNPYGAATTLAANMDVVKQVAGIRSQLSVSYKNTSTVQATVFLLALASDT